MALGRLFHNHKRDRCTEFWANPFIFLGNGILPVIKREIDMNASGVRFIFVLKKNCWTQPPIKTIRRETMKDEALKLFRSTTREHLHFLWEKVQNNDLDDLGNWESLTIWRNFRVNL